MAHRLLTPAIVRYRLTPWWGRVFLVWLASRVVTTSLLLLFASWQPRNDWTGPHPDYFRFAQLWDSTWYHIVAISGYPSQLPYTSDGHVQENSWAFLPVYPMTVRALMAVTGIQWAPLSVFVSLVFSLASALMFYRIMKLVTPGSALFSVVLFCVAPLSPIMQVAYAEPMALFFLMLALYLLIQRRYVLLFPVVAVMAFTRPIGLAFALTMGLHLLYRWFTRRRDPFTLSERILVLGVTAFSLVMGFAWTVIAAAVTGVPTAYTDTELAWRSGYVGYGELAPFTPWIQGVEVWGNYWQLGWLAWAILALLVIGFFGSLFLPAVRRLGVDLRLWMASYGLYILAVFFPQSSIFRLVMPMFPLLGALAQPRSWVYRASVVVLLIAGQFGWLYICWWVDGYDWTPP